MRKSSILFFVIGLGALAATMLILDTALPGVVLLPLSFVATWVLSVALLLASFGPSGFAGAYRATARGGGAAELGGAVAFFASAKRLLVATASLGVILAGISILSRVSRPEELGPPLAFACCSILYSAIGIVFAVEPFRASVEKRLAELA
jgi:hypothetical protein